MEILIIINDAINKYNGYQATGIMNQVERRHVKLRLTKEQVEDINLKEFESIESISKNL